jgi:hypothetical protein
VKNLPAPAIFFFAFVSAAGAEVEPVAVRVPQATAWIGQRVPFYVELRAPGSFEGTAAFDLPQLPGTLLMKVGNPVVSSQDFEGRSWFVQTHEFALFSQKSGLFDVPPFPVRFASREGFTGPARDTQAQAPAWKVEIRRPPGTESIGFLITTQSLDVTETWEPQPGPAQVGAVFKRTIVQRAPHVSGMALAPAPGAAPEGIRVYAEQPEVKDQTERGEFLGERLDTITYLLQKPGALTLPAFTYVWWNPKKEVLERKTLPSVTFEVTPLAAATGKVDAPRLIWPWLFAMVSAVGLGAWQRRRLWARTRQGWKVLNPPDRVAARRLFRACRRHDAAAAESAWATWRNMQGASFQPGPELQSALVGLERRLFGPAQSVSWHGEALARAFGDTITAIKARKVREPASALPLLNP